MSSVAKVFQVLEAVVSHQARGLAYSEVVAETRLPKATAHRLLKSLASLGYLRFEPEAGRYFGDLKLSALGSAVTSHFELKRYVRPYLLQLQADTGHASNLGVLSGDAGVYLDKVESDKAFGIKLYSEIGKRFPLHCTAMGKVLLAWMPPAERRRIVARRLETFTPYTITDAAALDRALHDVRRRGYAVDRQEITHGIMCVAAPIQGGDGRTVGAVSVAFPAHFDGERGIRKEIRAVTACAAAVSTRLREIPSPAGDAGETANADLRRAHLAVPRDRERLPPDTGKPPRRRIRQGSRRLGTASRRRR
jgi:DNA-binding IclR family transcriptional regulator